MKQGLFSLARRNIRPARRRRFAAGLASLFVASPALAAGGAHVVDDAGVETPGTCHLEAWITQYGPDLGLVNLAPACTRRAWPRLEIGGAIQYPPDGLDETTVGPALKFLLRPEESGFGLSLIGGGNLNLRSGRLETASLVLPVTAPAGDRLRFNFNAGWLYSRAGVKRYQLFYGAQVEAGLARDVKLMAEGFDRDDGKPGWQAGLRWNPHSAEVDLDLLVGERVDGSSPRAVTVGLTLRR